MTGLNSREIAEAVSGRVIGVLAFSGFGTIWLCLGLAAMQRFNAWTIEGAFPGSAGLCTMTPLRVSHNFRAALWGSTFSRRRDLFRYRAHYVTGTVLVAWSAGSVILLREKDISSIDAVETAVILRISAAKSRRGRLSKFRKEKRRSQSGSIPKSSVGFVMLWTTRER